MLTEKSKKNYLKNIKPSLNNIAKYVPGESDDKNGVKLSANESPFSLPNDIKLKTLKLIQKSNKYPDGDSSILKESISKKYNINKNQIICGNGSDDILSLIGLAFSRENCEIICSKYSFLFYPIIAYSVGSKVKFSEVNGLKICPENILKKITNKTSIIYIANPNNPTGSILYKKELIKMLSEIPKNIIVVIDGAYAEFVEKKEFTDGIDLIKNFPNVIITRTFSKIYAMAGFRIGWAYSSLEIIQVLEKIRGPFNVNLIAQIAASLILKNTKFIRKSIDHNKKWRSWLAKKINSLGLEAINSHTNFILVKVNSKKFSAESIVRDLKKQKIFVRELNNYNLKNYFRISIGKESELKKLVKNLKNILKSYEKKNPN